MALVESSAPSRQSDANRRADPRNSHSTVGKTSNRVKNAPGFVVNLHSVPDDQRGDFRLQ